MSGLASRRQADIERLQALARVSRGQLVIRQAETGSGRIALTLNLPTAGSAQYPKQSQQTIHLQIDLPSRYPFAAPVARMDGSPIFHPNVFESGIVCVGSKWHPGEALDIYVMRLARLLCFDPMLVNLQSIAHAAAGHWYARALRQHPDAFPSARIDWQAPAERVVRECPSCAARIRLPAGRTGEVDCPRCKTSFTART